MIDNPNPFVNKATPGATFYLPETLPSTGTPLPADKWPQNQNLPALFTPVQIGDVEFKNRIFVSPMCQYSCDQNDAGLMTRWHDVWLGGLAMRGPGLVMTEASAVLPNGRISPQDVGLWSEKHRDKFRDIFGLIHSFGSKAGVQLAHAGRKASTLATWVNGSLVGGNVETDLAPEGEAGGWPDNVWGPSAIPFGPTFPKPKEMRLDQIQELKDAFVQSVKWADEAGADVVELHGAHGYLLCNFLSPLSNRRTDKYGGTLENRMRLVLEIVELSRAALSKGKPLFLRISATEWHPEGEQDAQGNFVSWGVEQSKVLLKEALKLGVALIDVSSGGNDARQAITTEPGYQVKFAKALIDSLTEEERAKVKVSAVGLITNATQAEKILQNNEADVVSIAREFIRDSELVFNWAQELGVAVSVPVQQERAFTRMYKRQDDKSNVDKSLAERISDAMPPVPSVDQLKRPISDLVPNVVGALKDGARQVGEGKESAP